MIRTILASPWLPISYWAVVVIVIICGARRESLKRRLRHHDLRMVVSAPVPTPAPGYARSSTLQLRPSPWPIAAPCRLARFWYPKIAVFQLTHSSIQRFLAETAANKVSILTGARSSAGSPTTMLWIRADPPDQAIAKTLAIQCRTSATISNAHGRSVTIYGVVTQEVVSSTGKILILAGSKVVGSGLLDPENGRFKSDGLWSIFFDDTELKVQALLLDRPAGLPGMLGQESLNEDEAIQREGVLRDGRFIFVPRHAPFALEVHGEISLRDLKSNEASN